MGLGVYRPDRPTDRGRRIGSVTDAADPDRPGALLTLVVPRVVPALALSGGLLVVLPLVRALAEDRVGNPAFQAVVGLVGLLLLGFGLDTALLRVRLHADRVEVRRLLRERSLPWTAVRGVSLVSDGSTPRLRVVGREHVLQVPAWSLQARYADGEVEPAPAALPRFGGEHGVRTKVRTLADPWDPTSR